MTIDVKNKTILLSKPNQIGDAILAFPLASALKKLDPSCRIIYLGKAFIQDLVALYADIDEFISYESLTKDSEKEQINRLKQLNVDVWVNILPVKKLASLAKKTEIPIRIGVWRLFHLFTCNRFVNIRRSHSELHETQLDMLFLKAFTDETVDYRLPSIIQSRHFKPFPRTSAFQEFLCPKRFNLIIHPKTRGEHIEWPQKNFSGLIELLPEDKYKIFITGNEKEGEQLRKTLIKDQPNVTDLTGKMSLYDLIYFIAHADGLIAGSTGPVHLAAAFGIKTLGLYAPIRPFHAGRWGPVGKKTTVLCVEKSCSQCRDLTPCQCVAEITVSQVKQIIDRWNKP